MRQPAYRWTSLHTPAWALVLSTAVLGGCQSPGLIEQVESNQPKRLKRDRQKQVIHLDLRGMDLKPEAWEELGRLEDLRWLALPKDAGPGHLNILLKLKSLESLSLYGCRRSDQQVARLGQLKRLRHLNLVGTGVSEEAVAALRRQNPGLRIYH
ncbi:MAG: hypothetical protein R3236_07005 [Phycisphaeraceae bacterium]|nr:hypothetical protein [Phycisphaeraceae bacterium]